VILEGFHPPEVGKENSENFQISFSFLFSVCSHEYTRLIKELYCPSG
jgi:hypothetical protein